MKTLARFAVLLVSLLLLATPVAAQILDCNCSPGTPPHPNMTPATTFQCVGGNVVATSVFNRQVANTVATRGALPGFSSANTFGTGAACGPHQGLRLAASGSPLGTGIAPIGAVATDANTVAVTYDGTDALVQALIASPPVNLQVSATYFAQPHLVDQAEFLCIQIITGVASLNCVLQVPVDIDIKPGSFPNSINSCSKGAIPIAILGSATLDVTTINPATLAFAGAGIKLVGKTDRILCSVEDVSGPPPGPGGPTDPSGVPDGFDDLVCHFVTVELTAITSGDTSAQVMGLLFDATPLEGTDSINIVRDDCL